MIIVKHHNKNILFFKLKNIQLFASVVYLLSLHVSYDKNLKKYNLYFLSVCPNDKLNLYQTLCINICIHIDEFDRSQSSTRALASV